MLDRMPARRPRYRRGDLSPYDAFGDVGRERARRPVPLRLEPRPPDRREPGTGDRDAHVRTLLLPRGGRRAGRAARRLGAAIAITRDKIGRTPRSIVFPRNQFDDETVSVCGALGLVAYRGNPHGWRTAPGATTTSPRSVAPSG
jgi:hypothetical protein